MTLQTTRRSFVAALAALLSAPIRASVPPHPHTAPGPRHWLWIHASKWTPDPSSTRAVMQITAQRSDGQYFFVNICEWLEALLDHQEQLIIETDIQNAYQTLNDFLECPCLASKPCPKHYIPPPTPEELAELHAEFGPDWRS